MRLLQPRVASADDFRRNGVLEPRPGDTACGRSGEPHGVAMGIARRRSSRSSQEVPHPARAGCRDPRPPVLSRCRCVWSAACPFAVVDGPITPSVPYSHRGRTGGRGLPRRVAMGQYTTGALGISGSANLYPSLQIQPEYALVFTCNVEPPKHVRGAEHCGFCWTRTSR